MTQHGFVSTMMTTANTAKHVRCFVAYKEQKVREA